MASETLWPEGKRFAFTVFDDTDRETIENVGPVYALLRDLGFRTTKSVWMHRGDLNKGSNSGQTCEDPEYRDWVLRLQAEGFEIGWHNTTWHGVPRAQILAAFDEFAEVFGHNPACGANHSVGEAIYWGNYRVTGLHAFLYNVLTRFRKHRRYLGHVEGGESFWGDACRERIKYYRNFVFRDINTLKACPWMPYHDPLRPYVNYWFASSEGAQVSSFNECLADDRQDRLEEEGGACIMYTHFAYGFVRDGKVRPPDIAPS